MPNVKWEKCSSIKWGGKVPQLNRESLIPYVNFKMNIKQYCVSFLVPTYIVLNIGIGYMNICYSLVC